MQQRAGKSKASCRRRADAVEQRHEETCTVSIVLGQWFNSIGWIREHLARTVYVTAGNPLDVYVLAGRKGCIVTSSR